MDGVRASSLVSTQPVSKDVGVTSDTFSAALNKHGRTLERMDTTTLQINVGLLCNQVCRHCHLEAGPHRSELMDRQTLEQVFVFAQHHRFNIIDITGGATEMHPELCAMVDRLAPLCDRLMVRSNLSALEETKPDQIIDTLSRQGAVVVASFPSFNSSQLEGQRGRGVFEKSLAALKRLNGSGYGVAGSGLELDLVSNPTGAFLPPAQTQAEKRFREYLSRKRNITFNHLYTFANVPLGRFRKWLQETDNFDDYLKRLRDNFNPCVVDGLMCRSLLSVAWDGYLYDCDFNIAVGLPLGGKRQHITDLDGLPEKGMPIAVADHCFTCTAGSGFT